MGGRGMGELGHDQERVGRPSLALPRPVAVLGEYLYHREQRTTHTQFSPSRHRLDRLDRRSIGITRLVIRESWWHNDVASPSMYLSKRTARTRTPSPLALRSPVASGSRRGRF
jgi:hypothetical protein